MMCMAYLYFEIFLVIPGVPDTKEDCFLSVEGSVDHNESVLYLVTSQNVDTPKRRQPKRRQTETSTNRNVDMQKRRQTETSTNQNVDKPKRRQTKTSTSRNVDKPKRRQTKTSTSRNVDKPKRRHS